MWRDSAPVFVGGMIVGFILLGVFASGDGPVLILDNQTLASGILALIGAAGTVFYLHKQIHSEERRHARAAKAALPTNLSRVIRYAEESLKVAGTYFEIIVNAADVAPPKAPQLDYEVIQNLANASAVLPDPLGHQIAEALGWYQIQHARLEGLVADYGKPEVGIVTRVTTGYYAVGRLEDAGRLYLRIERLFDAAREGMDMKGEVTEEEIDRCIQFHLGLPGGLAEIKTQALAR